MTTNEEEGYAIVSTKPYPIEVKAMTHIETLAAERFIDTVARVDQSGDAFEHLCRLLGEVRYWRSQP